jgi:ankyrin repeat protein
MNPNHQTFIKACRTGDLEYLKSNIGFFSEINKRSFNNDYVHEIGSPMYSAITKGNIEVIKLLVEHGADIHKLDNHGYSTASLAIFHNQFEVLKYLIENGVDIKENGKSLLMSACTRKNIEIVKLLVENGSEVNSNPAKDGETPLHVSCSSGYFEIVEYLVSKGASIIAKDMEDFMPIVWASRHGKIKVFEFLLREFRKRIENTKVYQDEMEEIRRNIDYSIHIAAANGNLKIIEFLIREGEDVNKPIEGFTAFQNGAMYGHIELLKLLLANGSKIDEPGGRENETPLHLAARNHILKVITFLIKNGANVNSVDRRLKTPLHVALHEKRYKISEKLLKHGADPNARTDEDKTPLYETIQYGSLRFTSLLIDHGADVNARFRNKVPIFMASQYNNLGLVRLLLEKGANVNEMCGNAEYPIMYAVRYNHYDMIELMLDYGADVSVLRNNEDKVDPYNDPTKIKIRNLIDLISSGWTAENHRHFSRAKRNQIETFFKLHFISWISVIPKPLLFLICKRFSLI